ncbi:MAG: 50S ribosomal protein L35 [Phycisphaerae bacterium]|nr:50S ribosomal protein L35 [Phycisphaerae bacterium]
MPKHKTHKGLTKRVKVTARGKVKAHKSYAGHLMSGKNAKRRRRVGGAFVISHVFAEIMKEKLGQSGK